MRNIQRYLELLHHLATLVPGRYRGLVEVDGLVYEIWHNDTVVLIPHAG
jgi:hypothetical protein